jgi:hypothetical protein
MLISSSENGAIKMEDLFVPYNSKILWYVTYAIVREHYSQ